ncbi:MAG: hypothetical protein J5803_05745 [Desulfovibrio sp.]|nr:hypothetical protein [Desulfovibrio sp.]
MCPKASRAYKEANHYPSFSEIAIMLFHCAFGIRLPLSCSKEALLAEDICSHIKILRHLFPFYANPVPLGGLSDSLLPGIPLIEKAKEDALRNTHPGRALFYAPFYYF